MNGIRALWKRILGMTPRDDIHWRAWAIEQAVAAGASPDEVTHHALAYLRAVGLADD